MLTQWFDWGWQHWLHIQLLLAMEGYERIEGITTDITYSWDLVHV